MFQGRTSPTRKKLTNSSNRAWRGKKCLHLYKLACSIKRQGQKMSAFASGERKIQGGEMAYVRNLNQMLFFFFSFFFTTHYTSSVASLSKCVPSDPLLLSFKTPPPAKYLSNYFTLPLFWCHEYAIKTHGPQSCKPTKCFQTYFKHNLHSVCWFAWDREQCRPINHSQVWHSYLPFSLSAQPRGTKTISADLSISHL